MKTLKRTLSIIIALGTINLFGVTNCFADDISISENISNEDLVRNQVIFEYQDDYMFQQMQALDPIAAEEYISDEVLKRLTNQQDTISGSSAYCVVPVIQQSTSYYCGYASMLQALYGMGVGSSVSGSTYSAQQTTLAKMQSSTGTSAATVWMMVRDLNSYITNTQTYSYYPANNTAASNCLTLTTFTSHVFSSLAINRPPILHAYTGMLSYYQGANYSHYMVVDYIDQDLGLLEIVDCNYINDYYGSHMVSTSEAFSSISLSTSSSYNFNNDIRYLISL